MRNGVACAVSIRRILPAFALGIGLLASGRVFAAEGAVHIPSSYDHPFAGRMIVEQEALADVLADERCQRSWDAGSGHAARACSWHFDDPLNPGMQACHLVHPKVEDGVWTADQASDSLRIEMANCNGWHDSQEHAFSGW